MGLALLMRPTHCSACGTALMEAAITYEIIVREELFQIDDVPALVCRNCGEQWIDEEVRQNVEQMVSENSGPETHVN
ncbi:MAG: YgiT-type zinc finger protein [Chloroflexia bacterium]